MENNKEIDLDAEVKAEQRKLDRKMFAMAAMQGILANPSSWREWLKNYDYDDNFTIQDAIGEVSITIADSILKQLES